MLINRSESYRGGLVVVAVPKGSQWSLTLSDLPVVRQPPPVGAFGVSFGDYCKRRSNTPSLKRPDFPVAPEQKSGSRYPFALGLQRVGDEGRGALWARSLRGSDRGVELSFFME
jgi:hypothetical protein